MTKMNFSMIGAYRMRTRAFAKWCLAVSLLSFGLAGCGGGGIDEGMPPPDKKGVPLDPNMVNMRGMSPTAQKKATTLNAKAAKEAAGNPTCRDEGVMRLSRSDFRLC